MLKSTSCPDLHAYRELTSGQLAIAETESLLRHLETCDVCAGKIHTLPAADTLIEWIGQIKKSPPSPEDKQLTPLIERLIGMAKPAANSSVVLPSKLTFSCSGCGKPLRVKVEAAGKKVKCPHCGQVVQAPPVSGAGVSPVGSVGVETVDARSAPSGASKGGKSSGTATIANLGQSNKERELCSFLAAARMPDELGRLGSYRVLQVLGAGGMGVVFRAEDPQLQRPVALKAMLPALAANESARLRFLREARLAASLKHDHIVTIHQVGEDRGAPFLAMEFLEGEALEDRLKREGKLPLPEVLRIGREIADGLQAAHEHGLIHRDIKPANVWLEGKRGRVKILDFGLARSSADDVHLTQSGAIVGTPAYMPPEQARGEKVDARCDLYSLGCVLYRLCTGELPFKGENAMSLLLALAIEQPKSPRDLNPDVPPPLADLIMRLLAKDAAQRPATAAEVARTLQDIAEAKSPSPTAVPAPTPPRRRRRLPWAVAGGAFVLVAVLTIIVVRLGKPEEGSVTIETVDPDVELVFTSGGQNYTVRDKKTGEEIQLPLGAYQVQIKGGKEGLKLETSQFTLKRGERVLVKVTRQTGEKPEAARAEPSTIELLSLIEPREDAVKGTWERQGTNLIGRGNGQHAVIEVPYQPPEEYDYLVEFTRPSGHADVSLALSRDAHSFKWCMAQAGVNFGFDQVDGKFAFTGHRELAFVNGRRYTTMVKVRKEGMTAFLDGRKIRELRTDGSNLSMDLRTRLRNDRLLGLSLWDGAVTFHRIAVVEISGPGTLTRPKSGLQSLNAPVQIAEPPPLAEWLKGRKILTVSQDGKGQFKTIQAALDALKPGQVVKVLDRGPYRERLTLENVPAESGLVSEEGTLLEFPGNWRKVGDEKDLFRGHLLANTAGFRLHGFYFTFPEKKGAFFGLMVDQPDGFVLENCCFHTAGDRYFRDGQQFAVCFQANQIEFVRPVVVRECLIDSCVVFHSNIDGKEPRGTDFVLEKNYFTKSKGCTANGDFRKLIIRSNVFGEDTFLNLWDQKHTALVEVSNNTVLGNAAFQASAPQGTVRLCNNLVTGRESFQVNRGAEKALAEASKDWQSQHNVFQRRVGSTLLPLGATDRLAPITFLSQELGEADYLRIAAHSPLAKGGAGGAWPSYIGALPPGPAPKDGDWFTRLREKWRKDKPATNKKP